MLCRQHYDGRYVMRDGPKDAYDLPRIEAMIEDTLETMK